MASSDNTYATGKASLEAYEMITSKVLDPSIKHLSSRSLILTLACLETRHFIHESASVSPYAVQQLAIKLAQCWNKNEKYGYISNAKLEEQLSMKRGTRLGATAVLRQLGFFGVIEGRNESKSKEKTTNQYYPLFDIESRRMFSNKITFEYNIWVANQPIKPPVFDNEPPPF